MSNNAKVTRSKIVLSGNLLEVYEFEYPVIYDSMDGKGHVNGLTERTEEEKEENRKRAKSRARKKIMRLVHSNYGFWNDRHGHPYFSKFLTLTFRDPAFDVHAANKRFTLFIKRLNYSLFHTKRVAIQYIAVIEFQPISKKIHYHVVLFNLPYVERYYDVFKNAWGNGYIWIEKVSDNQRAAYYITKYMAKEEDKRLRGQKSYFCSRGLKKPVILRDDESVRYARSLISKAPTHQSQFENDYTGHTNYYRFDIRDQEKAKNFIKKHGREAV